MGKCICAADLTRRVKVQIIKTSSTVDSAGHVDESVQTNWIDIANEWCQFITAGSREFVVGDQLNQQITHQVTLRFSNRASKYTTKNRLVYDGRIFNIAGPPQNVDEQDKWLRFPATEVTPV